MTIVSPSRTFIGNSVSLVEVDDSDDDDESKRLPRVETPITHVAFA